MNTSHDNHTVAVFDRHEDAERAIGELQRSGFDMKKLSIVGRDYHTEEQAVGFYVSARASPSAIARGGYGEWRHETKPR